MAKYDMKRYVEDYAREKGIQVKNNSVRLDESTLINGYEDMIEIVFMINHHKVFSSIISQASEGDGLLVDVNGNYVICRSLDEAIAIAKKDYDRAVKEDLRLKNLLKE